MSCLCYNLPYLSSTFYEQFLGAYGLSNTQAGFLLTMFSLTATPGYLFGGLMADKFSAKKLIVLSTSLTAVIGIAMSFIKSYPALLVCYLGFGVTTTFLQWSAFLKLVRSQGDVSEQGKIFGFFELSYAIVGAITSYGILAFLETLIARTGFKIVTTIYGGLLIVIALLIWFWVKDAKDSETVNEFNFKMVGKVLKHPVTWINGFIVMGMFIIITGSSYLNPYLTQVFGTASALGVGITIFNRTIARIIFSPLGGSLIDRWGKTSKLLIIMAAGIIVACVAMMLIPQDPSAYTFAVIIILLFIVIMSSGRAGLYTPIPEADIPLEMTGTAMGIASAVGYSTDLWLYTLCGNWLDKYGAAGYQYILGLFIAGMCIVIVSAVLLQVYLNKQKSASAVSAITK
jgi:nitrate/nitrite transporter NarK